MYPKGGRCGTSAPHAKHGPLPLLPVGRWTRQGLERHMWARAHAQHRHSQATSKRTLCEGGPVAHLRRRGPAPQALTPSALTAFGALSPLVLGGLLVCRRCVMVSLAPVCSFLALEETCRCAAASTENRRDTLGKTGTNWDDVPVSLGSEPRCGSSCSFSLPCLGSRLPLPLSLPGGVESGARQPTFQKKERDLRGGRSGTRSPPSRHVALPTACRWQVMLPRP